MLDPSVSAGASAGNNSLSWKSERKIPGLERFSEEGGAGRGRQILFRSVNIGFLLALLPQLELCSSYNLFGIQSQLANEISSAVAIDVSKISVAMHAYEQATNVRIVAGNPPHTPAMAVNFAPAGNLLTF